MKPIHIGIGLTAVVLALALLELGPVLEVLAPPEYPGLGRHRVRQDHPAQRPDRTAAR